MGSTETKRRPSLELSAIVLVVVLVLVVGLLALLVKSGWGDKHGPGKRGRVHQPGSRRREPLLLQ